MKTKRTILTKMICLVLAAVMLFTLCACGKVNAGTDKTDDDPKKAGTQSGDLMEGVRAQKVNVRKADEAFVQSQMRLAVELFKKSAEKTGGENLLISPLSIQLALAMTANGAKGDTLAEMEKLLGGEFTIDELNEYLHTYVASLPSSETGKLEIANSIWFRDVEKLTVLADFLQKNADYYGAKAYKEPFDGATVGKINGWVKEHTDGMIEKIVEEIPDDLMLCLINAICFDAEWEEIYKDYNVRPATFTLNDGTKKTVDMMYSDEYAYLNDGKAEGFIKYYKNRDYAFAALLPNEGTDIGDYIAGLTYSGLLETLKGVKDEQVEAGLPKFSYDYGTSMNDILKALGMETAFDADDADFGAMGESKGENLYIGDVIHKTFIEVNERGTRAGAVTSVMVCGAAMIENLHIINLDRPFVYMIIDCATDLPVFIGAAMDIGE